MAKNRITIKLDDKKLNQQIKRALSKNPLETVKAVKECTLDLAANSAKRAPIDTGDLRNDCTADINGLNIFKNQTASENGTVSALKALGTVGYSLPYALRQHEELTYNHPKGGEAKFLERPFEERKDRYIKRIEKIVERSIK